MAKKPKPADPAEQSHYLQRAHIKDFRSIRDAVVTFKPGLNIIIGPNGSGKTNFVRCIESGLNLESTGFAGGDESTIKLVGEQNSVVNYFKRVDISSKKISLPISSEYRIRRRVVVSNDTATCEGNSLGEALTNYAGENYLNFSDFYMTKLVSIEHGIPNPYGALSNPISFSIKEDGWGNFSEQNGFVSTSIKNVRIAIFLSSMRVNKSAISIKTDILKITKNKLNFWLDFIKPSLKKYSPISDIKLISSIQAYENTSQNEVLIQGIQLEFKVNGDWLPFNALSSGTQRIFYIISEVLALNSLHFEIDNIGEISDYDFKIILLEEPELGIHPDQLERLLNFLREQSKKHQLIITTHSPQVLDMLNNDELDRITICELYKTKGTQFRKLKKTQIAAAKQYMSTQGLYLSDYWRYGSLESTL